MPLNRLLRRTAPRPAALSERLLSAPDALPALQAALQDWAGQDGVQLSAGARELGAPDARQRQGLALCQCSGQALGPGTGREEQERGWFLPLRGQGGAVLGAAWVPAPGAAGQRARGAEAWREAQALCDQAGLALQRSQALAQAQAAEALAHEQQLRNTLLAAIAHDHRTPLASILGAATALRDQAERLDAAQRLRLAERIVLEAEQLARITENSLQLARLMEVVPGDDERLRLRLDWESAEELVGSVLARLRGRDPGRRIKAWVQPGLPLLRVDAVLLVQLLDNLLDNALRHGGEGAIELRAELSEGAAPQLVLAVRDRGPGVPLAERQRIFEPFQRGAGVQGRGTGVGLALCRAIADAHGGSLRLQPREGGGAAFECRLPLPDDAPRPAG